MIKYWIKSNWKLGFLMLFKVFKIVCFLYDVCLSAYKCRA